MIKPVVKDTIFLGQKSEEATRADLAIADDLRDTLAENSEHCVGMAANTIRSSQRRIHRSKMEQAKAEVLRFSGTDHPA